MQKEQTCLQEERREETKNREPSPKVENTSKSKTNSVFMVTRNQTNQAKHEENIWLVTQQMLNQPPSQSEADIEA